MSGFIRIRDILAIDKSCVGEGLHMRFADHWDEFGSKKVLRATFDATHAGILTGNNAFYLPDKMRGSAGTWLADYGKPVLKHHAGGSIFGGGGDQDPIGRIVRADYVDTSGGLTPKFKLPKYMKDFIQGGPYLQVVDWVTDFVKQDVFKDPAYKGLGYTRLTADIMDKDAAQKFIDGRYLTVSVSFTSDAAICSKCKQNLVTEGKCEHEFGKEYDGEKAFIIPNKFFYDELSVVNRPADKHAKMIGYEIHSPGISDEKVECEGFNCPYEIQACFSIRDSVESEQMGNIPNKNKDDEEADRMPLPEVTALVEKFKELRPEFTDEQLKKAAEIAYADKRGAVFELLEDCVEDLSVSLEELFEDGALNLVEFEGQEADVDAIYDEMMKLWDEAGYPQEETDDAEGVMEGKVQDKKLTTAARKKLSKTTFCGPGRSFPVPDCKHAATAKTYLARYKGPGDKKTILACVVRKQRSLGCTGFGKTAKGVGGAKGSDSLPDCADLSKFDDEKLKELFMLAEAELVERKLSVNRTCSGCKDLQKKLDGVKGFEDRYSALRQELLEMARYQIELEDEVISLKKEAKQLKAERLADLSLLAGKAELEKKDEAVNDFLLMKDELLTEKITEVEKDIDFKKLFDKINDGTDNTPSGEVKNPVDEPPAPVDKWTTKHTEQFNKIKDKQGEAAAWLWLADKKVKRLIKADFEPAE